MTGVGLSRWNRSIDNPRGGGMRVREEMGREVEARGGSCEL